MNQPNNIFTYATSELSHDAFICWLIMWGNAEYASTNKELYDCAQNLIREFLHSNEKHEKIIEVQVYKQKKDIDVLCIINKKIPIKIFTNGEKKDRIL